MLQFHIDHIGNTQSPIIVIENFWPNPEELVEIAATRNDYGIRSLYYPGIRSSAPPEYAHAVVANLHEIIRSAFAVQDELTITDSTFSITATPAEKLVPFQRVPHFDSTDPRRFAVLHYLCGSGHGGTSFYRHRSSGTEVVTEEMRDRYIRTVNAEVKAVGMPPALYVDGDTELFERIAKYETAFNRALVYQGNVLHSVNVRPNFVPDPNPRTGRLTMNTFLLAKAPS